MEKLQRTGQAALRTCSSMYERASRTGAILVWLALLLTLLLGMVGLVIDAGLLMATHRQAQNAADAAALAAADDLMSGRGEITADATARTFVGRHIELDLAAHPEMAPVVNIGPAPLRPDGTACPYADLPEYAEVIVTAPMQTFFIHILGVSRDQTVRARAVAGSESYAGGEGVCVLDPNARPGLYVGGMGAELRVRGRIYDNSEGGGVDEDGAPVAGDPPGSVAAAVGGSEPGVYAGDIRIVGGVDDPTKYGNVEPGDLTPVLHCLQLPIVDPFINLETPTTALGVDPSYRGSPNATSGGALNLNTDGQSGGVDPFGVNYIKTMPDGQQVMVLHPGLYGSITVEGGNVVLTPGIYVLTPKNNVTNALKITGGSVTAEGVMFYNTGNSYTAATGTPDCNDVAKEPPQKPTDMVEDDPPTQYWGAFQINAGMKFSPIGATLSYNLGAYKYPNYTAPVVSDKFKGMLFFQRRRNNNPLVISGNAEEGDLAGTLYAKWAPVDITGQGTYDAQFVVGSMKVTGNGVVTVNYTGPNTGMAPAVFLVE